MPDQEETNSQPHSRANPTPAGTSPEPYVLGDFELGEVIGRGGMGTVYRAWQRSLRRTVAVKLLADHIAASPKAVQRFEREAQAAGKLHHTHIIPIFARGNAKGKYFYAMELVEGASLFEVITEGREHQQADTATVDLAETVPLPRAASTDGDLPRAPSAPRTAERSKTSSGSITLGRSTVVTGSAEYFDAIAEHIATIADALDHAHAQGVIHRDIKPHNLLLGTDGRLRIGDFGLARLAQQPGVTVTGEVLGSPLYMSPEQLSGGPTQVDSRTDIYSLGATMYEWLTLAPPYEGETRESVISGILTGSPVSPRSHNPNIPVDLETICLKALHRDPGHRYASGADFRDDLIRFREQRPIKARRAGIFERASKFVARHPLATVIPIAAVAVFSLSWALFDKLGEVKTQSAAATKAEQDTERLLDLIAGVLPVPGVGAAGSAIEGLVERGDGLAFGESSGGAAPDTALSPQGIAHRAVLDMYDALEPPVDATESGEGDGGDGFAGILREAAAMRRTDPDRALAWVDMCLRERPDDPSALVLQTALYGELYDYEAMARGAELLLRSGARKPTAFLWRGLSRLLLNQLAECLEDLDRVGGSDALAAWTTSIRALALVHGGTPGEAIAALDETLMRAPDLIVARLARAGAAHYSGDHASALVDLDHVIELEPENADVLAARGDHRAAMNDFDGAIGDFEAAIHIAGQSPAMALRVFTAMFRRREAEAEAESVSGGQGEADGGQPTAEPDDAASGQGDFDWFSEFEPNEDQAPAMPRPARPGPRSRSPLRP